MAEPNTRRYAQAIFQIALDADSLEEWSADLAVLEQAVQDEEFRMLLDAPEIGVARKVALVRDVLGDSVSSLAANLIALLASRNIARSLPGIVSAYSEMWDAHRGIRKAEVVSAIALAEQEEERVRRLLTEVLHLDVSLTSRVDPQILGGLVIRVGDRLFDGSTRARFQDMRQSLAGGVS